MLHVLKLKLLMEVIIADPWRQSTSATSLNTLSWLFSWGSSISRLSIVNQALGIFLKLDIGTIELLVLSFKSLCFLSSQFKLCDELNLVALNDLELLLDQDKA